MVHLREGLTLHGSGQHRLISVAQFNGGLSRLRHLGNLDLLFNDSKLRAVECIISPLTINANLQREFFGRLDQCHGQLCQLNQSCVPLHKQRKYLQIENCQAKPRSRHVRPHDRVGGRPK